MKVVIFTWQGGGATQPAFGLGRLLAARGDDVRIIAPAAYADRAAAAGCAHRPFPPAVEFDPSAGRAAEDQEEFMFETALGGGLPALLLRELEAEPADVVVVDFLLRSTVAAAEASGAAVVLLVHMSRRWHGRYSDGDDAWSTPWQFRKLNEYRRELGIEDLLDDGTASVATELTRRAAGTVIALPREFDDWATEEPPPHAVHVGSIPEAEAVGAWELPWPDGDERPLVVVTFGTTYMHQEDELARVAAALGRFDVRAIVLTGVELEPGELDLHSDVEVRAFVPHAAVLPDASLVITHGGMGTLMAALSAGVPMVCLPLGRDQSINAERAAELGTAVVIDRESSEDEIAAAIGGALESDELRIGAKRMADAIAAYDGGVRALDVIDAAAAQ